ncbi:hypothetical protein [Methylorubrum sp. SL192]|uniref:hypothetical protein n=1 Tax=Methylorubrum sp. SL192 TaxID=2995167 RepID=UPI00070082C4|nr:hypothetical protein [Methylorubrum sp. SL192]KQO89449.1 hypothetical protein ASF33_19150 [Methylobacterium sp. Leaf92]MCY1644927.1 hypothetical protein [Methylorubrum sp. SL192]
MAKYTRFYLTKWKDEGDSVVCRLMEREGSDDGTDAIVAEFSMHPAPLGERLAVDALATANAYAEAGSIKLTPGMVVELPAGTEIKRVDVSEAKTA